jgi:HlyD family secretion protein
MKSRVTGSTLVECRGNEREELEAFGGVHRALIQVGGGLCPFCSALLPISVVMNFLARLRSFSLPARLGFGALLVCALVVGLWLRRSTPGAGEPTAQQSSTGTAPVMAAAKVAPFVQEVVERGEIQSSSNVEVRCEVAAKNTTGTTIIQIIPEGTHVKPGDVLVKLDDSALQADRVVQQIAVNAAKAAVAEASATLEAAKLSLAEYESGTFRQEEQTFQSEEFVAQEDLRRAEEYLRYSVRLASRGYVTEVQLEADRFAVEKARKTLASAQTKLDVLHKFTKQKMQNQLKAGVETAQTKLVSQENSFALDDQKLKNIERQIAACIVVAPTSGQVVYAQDMSSRGGENTDPSIAEGKQVRERQVMVRLPDPTRMHVMARVNEANIDKVKKGMKGRVRVDALAGVELVGTVQDVSEYPLSRDWWSSLKEYAAEVEIENPPPGLRSGMSAQVSIEIQKLPDVLQVPVQAVLAQQNRHFILMPNADEDELPLVREVKLGPSNETNVVIRDGLQALENVLLAPQNYQGRVALPDALPYDPKAAPAAAAGGKRGTGAKRPQPAA